MKEFLNKVGAFFKKVGLWFVKIFNICKTWIIGHKIPSIIIASSVVLVLVVTIVVSGVVKANKKDPVEPEAEDLPFVIDVSEDVEVVTLPTATEFGSVRVKGQKGDKAAYDLYQIGKLNDKLYYTPNAAQATCTRESGVVYNTIDNSFIFELASKYGLNSDDAESFYTAHIKTKITNIFVGSGLNNALGHSYNQTPTLASAATTTSTGEIEFTCTRDGNHKIIMTVPVLSSSSYIVTEHDATCAKKPNTDYVLRSSISEGFLINSATALFSSNDEFSSIVAAIETLTKQNIEDANGSLNMLNHTGEIGFNLKGHEPTYTFDTEPHSTTCVVTNGSVSVYCAGCSQILGYCEDVKPEDGYWRLKDDVLVKYYDLVYDGTTYKGIESLQSSNVYFTITIRGGGNLVVETNNFFSESENIPWDGTYTTYRRVINLAYIKDSVLDANAKDDLTNADITIYIDGVEYSFNEYNDGGHIEFVCRRGNALYICLGDYGEKQFYGNVDICFNFENAMFQIG